LKRPSALAFRFGRDVLQPDHVLANAIAGHESEPRLGTNEEWPAETKHDGMKEELVLIDQPKLGQACR
jgi:hypothetical protein